MSQITDPHDRCFRQLMTNLDNARSFFRRYLTTELQASIDLNTLELQEGSKVTQAFQQLHLDMLYRVDFKSAADPSQIQQGYLYCVVEHQSTPDPAMAVRLWQYKAALLVDHVKGDYLPPIHSMVFYHGQQTPYPYTLDLRSCFRTPQQAEYTLQGPPQLIDLGQKPDQELLASDSAGLFSYFFKHVRDEDVYAALEALPASLIQAIAQHSNGFYTLKVLMSYYKLRANTQEPLKAFMVVADKLESDEQREAIMTIGEALLQEGMQKGLQQGRQEGVRKGMQEGIQQGLQKGLRTVATNMIQQGMSVELIQQATGLTSEEIQTLIQEQSSSSTH